jgi:hypothetical protein
MIWGFHGGGSLDDFLGYDTVRSSTWLNITVLWDVAPHILIDTDVSEEYLNGGSRFL